MTRAVLRHNVVTSEAPPAVAAVIVSEWGLRAMAIVDIIGTERVEVSQQLDRGALSKGLVAS